MVTLLVAMVPLVCVQVMAGPLCMMGVQVGAVVVVVRRHSAAEALTQSQLGRQLPNGLPLVQDGLSLLHQALPQVEDSGFGLLARPPPASRRCTLMA